MYFYIIFNYYLNNLIDVFKIWQGGMSFHGGLVGVIAMSVLFAKKNGHRFFYLLRCQFL